MYYLSMFAFESVGVKLPNCISDGWQPLASTHLAAAGRKSGQAFFLHAPWPAWVATKKANAFCGVWGDPEWIQEWFLLVHEDWLFWEGSWKWLNSITNVGESHHFIYCSNWNVPLFKADCPKRGLCFRVNKHATSIHLHWYIRRLCSGMNWCWWMLLLQKSVAFLKQLTAFGDREGCVVGYRLGASRSSSTVSDSLHQELMICQTKALWSNIRWIMASFFGDDSIVTTGDDVTVDYDGQVRCHSFEDQLDCRCKPAVRRWKFRAAKDGEKFRRCRTIRCFFTRN